MIATRSLFLRRRVLGALVLVAACNAAGRLGPALAAQRSAGRPGAESPLGLRVVDLGPDAAGALSVAGGVRVVHSTGLAWVSGLRAGDVIVEVDGRPVLDTGTFWDRVAGAAWRPTLRVLRRGASLSLRIAEDKPVH